MNQHTTAPAGKPSLHFCTIVSKNYLPQARALGESIRDTNPGCPVTVLLVDRIDGCFDPAAEPFTVLPIEELPIPDMPRFCFQYDILELNTAAKPFFLAHLFKHAGAAKVVYLDPDIIVLRKLDEMSRLLDEYNVLLTPHVLDPIPLDGKRQHERDVLMSGTYNLGFVALSAGREADRLLRWWQERLYTGCRHRIEEGWFVDQKWMELAPSYFDGVHILREPGYNIAYWNLFSREVTLSDGRIWVDGRPAYFFHFSGFDPDRPLTLSKYQDRLRMEDVGAATLLFAEYVQRLARHGRAQTARWPYAFGFFDNGVPIPSLCRRLYLEMGEAASIFGDPFRTDGGSSFYRWLTTPSPGRIAPFLRELQRRYPDLIREFPDVDGKDRRAFTAWARHSGHFVVDNLRLPQALLEAALANEAAARPAPEPPAISYNLRGDCKPTTGPFGVNLSGYLQSEKGVGQAARSIVRALDAAHIPYALNEVCDLGSKNRDVSCPQFATTNPYAVNIVMVNADMAPTFFRDRPRYSQKKLTIGYWNWELSEFPAMWHGVFSLFDEVWAPSRFTRDAVAAASPIPVRCIPFPVTAPTDAPPWIDRGCFGLPDGVFLFLFAFDLASYMERKNPLGLVRAFQQAFGDRDDVGLVLKTMHSQDGEDVRRLYEACAGCKNIHLLHQVLSRRETTALMGLCDGYVSLHRSEGFGLTIAEAMAMGKPVVATNYSANEDFMTESNSRPIRWKPIALDRDHGPYRKGLTWADPDLDQAAAEMRRLVDDPAFAQQVGATARADIARQLSPAAVGAQIVAALTGGVRAAA